MHDSSFDSIFNQPMKVTMQEPTPAPVPFDLNALLTEALKQAIHQATKDLYLRIASLEGRLSDITTASDERIKEIAEEVAEDALCNHANAYDHDEYDRLFNDLGDKIDDAINDFDISDKISEAVNEAINDLDISDKINDALNGATVSISV